ncbi:MAG: carbohydrate kinase [Microcoleaceae cyanobacterium]
MLQIDTNALSVLCLGEVLFDAIADQPGSPESVQSWTAYPGGAPANVTCALVKLGTTSGLISAVGQDQAGKQLVQLLQRIGVNTAGVQTHPTAPTRKVYVVRSISGEREFAGFGDRQTTEFADTYLQANLIPEDLFIQRNSSDRFLVLGTLALAGHDSSRAVMRAIELAKQHQLNIFVDVNWRPMFWLAGSEPKSVIRDLLSQTDFVKFSDSESEWLFQTPDPTTIYQQLGTVKGVFVTLGERGCAYHFGEHSGYVPGFPVKVQDTTGAGDGFVAGLIHQFVQYGLQELTSAATIQQAVTYANAVGALVTMKTGAIVSQPTVIEIKEFLANYEDTAITNDL